MLIVPDFFEENKHTRSHPWSVTEYSEDSSARQGRYYNFTEHPELIPQVLEDFLPFAGQPSTRHFYNFLRWINGSDTYLETNDCAFRGPFSNPDIIYRYKLKSDGRVHLFYRDHIFNTLGHAKSFRWLVRMLCLYLQLARPDFREGHVGVSILNTHYLLVPEPERKGRSICLTFNAYGDTEDAVFHNLFILFDGVLEATKRVSSALKVDIPPFP